MGELLDRTVGEEPVTVHRPRIHGTTTEEKSEENIQILPPEGRSPEYYFRRVLAFQYARNVEVVGLGRSVAVIARRRRGEDRISDELVIGYAKQRLGCSALLTDNSVILYLPVLDPQSPTFRKDYRFLQVKFAELYQLFGKTYHFAASGSLYASNDPVEHSTFVLRSWDISPTGSVRDHPETFLDGGLTGIDTARRISDFLILQEDWIAAVFSTEIQNSRSHSPIPTDYHAYHLLPSFQHFIQSHGFNIDSVQDAIHQMHGQYIDGGVKRVVLWELDQFKVGSGSLRIGDEDMVSLRMLMNSQDTDLRYSDEEIRLTVKKQQRELFINVLGEDYDPIWHDVPTLPWYLDHLRYSSDESNQVDLIDLKSIIEEEVSVYWRTRSMPLYVPENTHIVANGLEAKDRIYQQVPHPSIRYCFMGPSEAAATVDYAGDQIIPSDAHRSVSYALSRERLTTHDSNKYWNLTIDTRHSSKHRSKMSNEQKIVIGSFAEGLFRMARQQLASYLRTRHNLNSSELLHVLFSESWDCLIPSQCVTKDVEKFIGELFYDITKMFEEYTYAYFGEPMTFYGSLVDCGTVPKVTSFNGFIQGTEHTLEAKTRMKHAADVSKKHECRFVVFSDPPSSATLSA